MVIFTPFWRTVTGNWNGTGTSNTFDTTFVHCSHNPKCPVYSRNTPCLLIQGIHHSHYQSLMNTPLAPPTLSEPPCLLIQGIQPLSLSISTEHPLPHPPCPSHHAFLFKEYNHSRYQSLLNTPCPTHLVRATMPSYSRNTTTLVINLY